MTDIVLVQASTVWTDGQAQAVLPGLQAWDDRYVRPAYGLDKCAYHFATFADFRAGRTAGAWPLFLNRHSVEPGVLGFHDDKAAGTFGRVFIGDCIRYGVSPTVDISHEAAEMRWNSLIDKFFTIPDGPFAGAVAPQELADAVEADEDGIDVGNMRFTDVVWPDYWSAKKVGKFDARGLLRGHCPSMLPGVYQSLYGPGALPWHQVNARHLGGPATWRSTRFDNTHRGLSLRALPSHLITGVTP